MSFVSVNRESNWKVEHNYPYCSCTFVLLLPMSNVEILCVTGIL